jgi:hypothetical protein
MYELIRYKGMMIIGARVAKNRSSYSRALDEIADFSYQVHGLMPMTEFPRLPE